MVGKINRDFVCRHDLLLIELTDISRTHSSACRPALVWMRRAYHNGSCVSLVLLVLRALLQESLSLGHDSDMLGLFLLDFQGTSNWATVVPISVVALVALETPNARANLFALAWQSLLALGAGVALFSHGSFDCLVLS